eukprot:gene5080-2110_t
MREEDYEWRNIAFYRGFTTAPPSGFTVDQLLKPAARGGRAGDYVWLEGEHNWVQWAFPTTAQGVNPFACTLTARERDVLQNDPDLRQRTRRMAAVFLDFLGMQFVDTPGTAGAARVRVARVVGGGWCERA